MNLREALAAAVARDPRYTIEAYEFIFAALDLAKVRKRKARKAKGQGRARKGRKAAASRHVTGQELCEAARDLALDLYGLMALPILQRWGMRSTSDIGSVVYNLIASGDLERSRGHRADFDDVFDFETALGRDYAIPIEDPTNHDPPTRVEGYPPMTAPTDRSTASPGARQRFAAALAGFGLWVAFLAVLAMRADPPDPDRRRQPRRHAAGRLPHHGPRAPRSMTIGGFSLTPAGPGSTQ